MADQRADPADPLEQVKGFLEEWERLSTEAGRHADEQKLARELVDEFIVKHTDLADQYDRSNALDPADRLMANIDPDFETTERKILGGELVNQDAERLENQKQEFLDRARIRARVWDVRFPDPHFQRLCKIISDLNPSDGNVFGHLGELFQDLLKVASETFPAHAASERLASAAPAGDIKKRSPYSSRDAKVYESIGRQSFENLSNAELLKRHRRTLGQKLKLATDEAIRSCFKRIRAFHQIPPPQKPGQR